ncbi:hypothetical protein PISMIDRAFT_687969 [Pisolithus microcarpus 441]|uniref:Uncharacterized protein n=1 Tax=Pisolithus microcarpus 441 TaxID=765257 RepID=A0A0C9YWE9_9AGAM|nr:hypothetical protein PISMIDRAFT_687969 [Pisolithus microcarpus 441]
MSRRGLSADPRSLFSKILQVQTSLGRCVRGYGSVLGPSVIATAASRPRGQQSSALVYAMVFSIPISYRYQGSVPYSIQPANSFLGITRSRRSPPYKIR